MSGMSYTELVKENTQKRGYYLLCYACHSPFGVHYEGVGPENTCVVLVHDHCLSTVCVIL